MTATRIVIFAKAPLPSKVKTRLIPVLGETGAAQLAHDMLKATLAEAATAGLGTPELCASPDPRHPIWQPFLSELRLHLADQGEGDLGERLARAARRVIDGGENILLIGTDCPGIDRLTLRSAAAALFANDAVIHPTLDGGYALLGLRRFDPSLFSRIGWSGPAVASDTISRIEALGWSLSIGATLRDIDEPEDLAAHLQSRAASAGE